MRPVAILHGWSDDSDSFKPLARFLTDNGYQAVPIWLGDYISMEDDVAIEDVARRMEEVVLQMQADGTLPAAFDLIVHSTGGLVAREWLSTYHGDLAAPSSVRRLLMLAPANYGSRLARTGKTFLGRLFKGGFKNEFRTGRRMLDALELGSAYQWKLVGQDMLVPPELEDDGQRIFAHDRVLPFVIVGSRGYRDLPRSIVDEPGSDGTVRVAAANLNTYGVTIDLTQPGSEGFARESWIRPWTQRFTERIPLAVLPDRHHSSVVRPDQSDSGVELGVPESLGDLILEALRCADIAAYRNLGREWAALSTRTHALGESDAVDAAGDNDPRSAHAPDYHRYVQVNVKVEDDHGEDVLDYLLEFASNPTMAVDEASAYFLKNVLEHVAVNTRNAALRTLYLDYTDWMGNYYARSASRRLMMRLSAAPLGRNVAYFSTPDGRDFAEGEQIASPDLLLVHEDVPGSEPWIQPDTTHFVKFIVPRLPAERVFGLKRFG